MATSHFCDICGEILKHKYYLLGVSEHFLVSAKEEKTMTITDFLKKHAEAQENATIKFICPECNKVFGHMFNIRLKNLKKTRKELQEYEKLFKVEGDDNGRN